MLKVLFLRNDAVCTPFMSVVEVQFILAQYENIRTAGTGNGAQFLQHGVDAFIKLINAGKKGYYLFVDLFNGNSAAERAVRGFSGR